MKHDVYKKWHMVDRTELVKELEAFGWRRAYPEIPDNLEFCHDDSQSSRVRIVWDGRVWVAEFFVL